MRLIKNLFHQKNSLILVVLLYILLTVVLTYPAISNFTTRIIGDGGDTWKFTWNFWWTKKALTEFQNPYFTNYLFHPNGTSLAFDALTPLNSLISIPLQSFFNLITTYNIIYFFSFIMSGLGMYLLALYLTKNKFASFIAGFMFAFSPYHIAHGLGHLNLIAIEWIPFYILYLLKTHKEYNTKNMLLAGLFLIFTALSSWYYLLFSLMFSGLYLLYFGIKENSFLNLLKKIAPIFILTALVLSPIFITMAVDSAKYDFPINRDPVNRDPEIYSADLLSFFIPGKLQTIGKNPFFNSITSRFNKGLLVESGNYIGFVILFLSLFSIIKLRKNRFVSFAALAGFIFFILSLGMHIHFLGKITGIPLPYSVLNELRIFSFGGTPGRFAIMLVISLAVLSSFALKEIFNMSSRKKRNIIMVVLCSMLFIEFLPLPIVTTSIEVPDFYKTISQDNEDYAIIDLVDLDLYSPQKLYYQTVHNKKIIGGYISRPTLNNIDFLDNTPVVTNILLNREPEEPRNVELKEYARNILRKYNVRYIVYSKNPESTIMKTYGLNKHREDEPAYASSIMTTYGLKKYYEDEQVEVYTPYYEERDK
ncbi:hypothetical protein ES703_46243 [subsurface metagenome]